MAIKVGVGLSIESDPLRAAYSAAKLAKLNLGAEKADLAIVFSSVEFAHSTVLKTISNSLGPVPIVGSSGAAIITREGIFKHGLIIMLLGLPAEVHLNMACVKEIGAKGAVKAGQELGEQLLYGTKDIRRAFGLIFSDGLMQNTSGFIYGLQEKLGSSFPLAGASSADDFKFKKTCQYFGQEVSSDAACGLLWSGKLNFALGIKHGWKPLGKVRTVTESTINTVVKIDDEPAAKIYEDYFAKDIPQLRKDLKIISMLYPIGVYLAGEEEYLLRNILRIEDNGSLIFQGDVPQLSKIRLMIGTKESCLAAAAGAAEEVKSALHGKDPDFVFVFDSASRYVLLGRQAHRELEIIKETLGQNTPIVGMYTYGEQAPLKAIDYKGRAYSHHHTVAILGLGG